MQAVILAAGRGTRMKELTDGIPKPMLKVLGKPILEHKLDALPASVTEVIFIVGYLGDAIRNYFGDSHGGRAIRYVEQKKLDGTAGALWCAKDFLHEKFLVMNGDDIYAAVDAEECLKHEWAMLVKESDARRAAGHVIVDESGRITDVVEGSERGAGTILVNAGMYALDPRIFELDPIQLPGKEEYGLPQTMIRAAEDVHIQAVPATFWLQITSPEDIATAETVLRGETR